MTAYLQGNFSNKRIMLKRKIKALLKNPTSYFENIAVEKL